MSSAIIMNSIYFYPQLKVFELYWKNLITTLFDQISSFLRHGKEVSHHNKFTTNYFFITLKKWRGPVPA